MEELTAIMALSRLKGLDAIQKKEVVDRHESIAQLFEGRIKHYNRDLKQKIKSFNEWGKISSP